MKKSAPVAVATTTRTKSVLSCPQVNSWGRLRPAAVRRPDADAVPEPDTNTISDANPDANTNARTDGYTDTGADADTHTDADSRHADASANRDAHCSSHGSTEHRHQPLVDLPREAPCRRRQGDGERRQRRSAGAIR